PAVLAFVPVGPAPELELARCLGLPTDVVSASRAVLGGAERPVGLLVDDSDAVLVGGLRIPAARHEPEGAQPPGVRGSLSRCADLVRPARWRASGFPTPSTRLRVEADGVLLVDVEQPVAELSVSAPADCVATGLAEVVVRQVGRDRSASGGQPLRVRARTVTVSGPELGTRTWHVARSSLRLTVPRG
ncbi:diacylglycerol kinase, partial [Streptomyces sp. OF3]|nr:diacylglycerol kinase [Streptomyces alkaliterrae]